MKNYFCKKNDNIYCFLSKVLKKSVVLVLIAKVRRITTNDIQL